MVCTVLPLILLLEAYGVVFNCICEKGLYNSNLLLSVLLAAFREDVSIHVLSAYVYYLPNTFSYVSLGCSLFLSQLLLLDNFLLSFFFVPLFPIIFNIQYSRWSNASNSTTYHLVLLKTQLNICLSLSPSLSPSLQFVFLLHFHSLPTTKF